MNVIVTGGLTGGHVMPCVSLALALTARGHDVTYLGARGQLEEVTCRHYGIRFVGMRYRRHGRVRKAILAAFGVVTSARAMRRFAPAVVFSKGSEAATPVVRAASRLRIPVVAHESDGVPGSETLRHARHCDVICLGDGAARRHLDRPTVVTGNMVRPNFGGGSRAEFVRIFELDPARQVVFVMGGSQGSLSINELVYPILALLTARFSVVHQCGPGKLAAQRAEHYVQAEFFGDEIKHVYAASSVVVARAGAGSIAEIGRYRIPAILIPLPWAENDHQLQNALAMQRRGVCRVIRQQDATSDGLLRVIEEMVGDRERYARRYAEWAHEDPMLAIDPVQRITALLESYAP